MIQPIEHERLLLDIDFIRFNCKRLYFFGLGFIQLKLNDDERIHFYTDAFQGTTTKEEVHNHRYDFESKIIRGTLIQELFLSHLDDTGNSLITKETCDPEIKKEFAQHRCTVKLVQRQTFSAGSSYWTDPDTLHRAESNDAITYVRRGPYMKTEADVVRPINLTSTCPFSVNIPDGKLWEVIRSMII